MNAPTSAWPVANQRYLVAALAHVRAALERHAGAPEPGALEPPALAPLAETMSPPPALEALCGGFGLSAFERDVLLLCAGPELDAEFAPLCARAQGDARRAYPTFSLALAALADAHWSALAPAGALRHWRMIEIGAGDSLTAAPLRLDERVLHYLAGLGGLDERLAGLLEPLAPAGAATPTYDAAARRIARLWSAPKRGRERPVVQLCGASAAARRNIAASACTTLGLNVYAAALHALPQTPAEVEGWLRLWQREAVLNGAALLLEYAEGETPDALRAYALARLIDRLGGAVFVSGREPLRGLGRTSITFDVAKPAIAEQRALWQQALGGAAAALDDRLDVLISHFDFDPPAIAQAAAAALALAGSNDAGDVVADALWHACRRQARPRLDDLAQRLEPAGTWDDLVLPAAQRQILRDIAAAVRQRVTVYDAWGFAAKSARGLGLSALFAGPSGTGKTMAAEVLAHELGLDLYRVDLSQVVSKYIGETEKNLRRIFDAAEDGGAILLFDEADALFGKRSETIQHANDRYANIEVSYLLQRMEAYRGLAILTTNMKNALDTAFMRRLRFVVQFPFPDAAQRAQIWSRAFPARTPTAALDLARLAQLSVAGGSIRNIALNAAFFAADAGEPVGIAHVLRAARAEYAKLEKPLDIETGGLA